MGNINEASVTQKIKYRKGAIFSFGKWVILFCLVTSYTFLSCKKFLDVDPPKSTITKDIVFSDDATATSALLGIYYKMYSSGKFASGDDKGIMALTGLSSDELLNYPKTDINDVQFEENNLQSDNRYVLGLWTSLYETIYQSNAIIEGLSNSNNLSMETKNQLKGEAIFIRALCHFYLVNLYGDIPYVTTTDYRINSEVSRINSGEIYDQLIEDLKSAIGYLKDNYPGTERIRPNKFTAIALLSRVYLFKKDWFNAEEQASLIIQNLSLYNLNPNLNQVFLKSSKEAIWQIRPSGSGASYTTEGWIFRLSNALNNNVLRNEFINAFESGDNRKLNWVSEQVSGSNTIYLPYKYKVSVSGSPLTEYSMVFRLAEQYLIRAEARAEQNNIVGAQEDINAIRNRAGLPNTVANDQASVLLAIENERKVELFTEWGHRWFDLKRRNRANNILGIIKPTTWNTEDQLYPLPLNEMNKNPNLIPQNPGY